MKMKYKKYADTEDELFPLEKILTISAAEYCAIAGKDISEYTPVGVHVTGVHVYTGCKPADELSMEVPVEAEVVVGYQSRIYLGPFVEGDIGVNAKGYAFDAHGTALIRKQAKGNGGTENGK
jgi:hypothetical protein